MRRVVVLVLAVCLASAAFAQAPAPQGELMKEVQVAADAFRRSAATPAWAKVLAVPDSQDKSPTVILLANTQYMLEPVQTVFIQQAFRTREATALADVGRFPISFNPTYEKVVLHRVMLHRG
ncbi:MAG: hypothetical protein KGQ77_08065, partial [Betaproteobacteria bacterium]|nr:hypothetical protein [Betaproteobacteria bacterium]